VAVAICLVVVLVEDSARPYTGRQVAPLEFVAVDDRPVISRFLTRIDRALCYTPAVVRRTVANCCGNSNLDLFWVTDGGQSGPSNAGCCLL